jgi:hypothetical protein
MAALGGLHEQRGIDMMFMRPIKPAVPLLLLLVALLLLPGCETSFSGRYIMPVVVAAPLPVETTMTLRRVVRFEHRLVNSSDGPADIEMFLAVPQDNERQRIVSLHIDPSFIGDMSDEYGNRILRFVDRGVPPGGVVAHGWMAEVEISSAVYGYYGWTGTGKTLSQDERAVYLRDGENYQITKPVVKDLAARLAEGSPSEHEIVRRAFRHLAENVRYERDDVWDPAPSVLERGTGSCSEYNYAFLALCRAAGIPARYTGGIVLAAGREAEYDELISEDAVFHRWSEVNLEGCGWFPVDCSRASGEVKRFGNPDNLYARLPAGLLQCVRGDGIGDTPLGFDYLSNHKVPYEEEKDWSGKVAFWIRDVEPGALQARITSIREVFKIRQDRVLFDTLLESTLDREILFLFRNLLKEEAIPDLVAALHAARHPEAVYWSILAEARGLEIDPGLQWSATCGPDLKAQILRYLVGEKGGRDLFTFEYWWRKARPKTRWDDAKGVFILTDKDINIY